MRINESKNKRMFIMEQITFRQHSREKSRKSSAERRKKIEESINDFTKTMSDVSYRKTGGSEAFKYDKQSSQKLMDQDIHSPEKLKLGRQYDEVLRSPSFKDIAILNENDQITPANNIQNSQIHVKFKEQTQKDQRQNNIVDEQINYRQSERYNEKLTPNSIVQNKSSASAIFFTSQFNQFISKNHLQSNQNLPSGRSQNSKEQNQGIKNENQLNHLPYSLQHNQSQQSKQQKQSNDSNQFKINFNHPNNNSQLSEDRKDKPDQIAEISNDSNHQPEAIDYQDKQKQAKNLIKNKSGHSLAFSNQSSLKFSLNESNIKEILNRKFTNELIADSNQFDIQNENSSLFFHLKFQIIADRLYHNGWKFIHKSFFSFAKLHQFASKVQKRKKRMYFQAFIINQELNLEEKKNQIKSNQYLKEKQQVKIKNVFHFLKFNFFVQPQQKSIKALQFQEEKLNTLKQRIFRCLKISWFDQKVKKQIDLYYMSKIFSHFAKVIKNQKQIARKKCLTFYCFNLKRRFFGHLKEGVDTLQTQRIQRDNADCHYSFGLQRKVFDAWKQKLSYKDRYISLAMTTKNTFKETSDQRWLQIKTVDFRQIK